MFRVQFIIISSDYCISIFFPVSRLHQLKTILANSSFNINEIVGKSSNGEDFVDDELLTFNENTKTNDENE